MVCASAGNHAQGVAFACRALDIKGRIYLPNTTPRQKRDRILSHGAGMVELVMTGDTFDDAALAAAEHAADIRCRAGAAVRRSADHRRPGHRGPGAPAAAGPAAGRDRGPGRRRRADRRHRHLPAGTSPMGADRRRRTGRCAVDDRRAGGGAAGSAGGDGPVRRRRGGPADRGAAVSDRRGGRRADGRPSTRARSAREMLRLYQNEGIVAEPAGALAVAALPSWT